MTDAKYTVQILCYPPNLMTTRKTASQIHIAPRIVVYCCPLLPIVAHCCTLLPIIVPLLPILTHCCPLLPHCCPIVAHCCPLLPTVAHCCLVLPIVAPLLTHCCPLLPQLMPQIYLLVSYLISSKRLLFKHCQRHNGPRN